MIDSKPMLRLASRALVAVAVVLFSTQALAEGGTKGDSKKSDDGSSDSGGAFKDAVAQGTTKYAARDFPGAVASFQKAIEADPKNPLGHYFLGEAQLAAGNMTEAEAAWNRASLEAADKDPALRAKILFVLADLKERQHKWDDARAAWQVYLDWAAKYPNAGTFVGSGQSRQNAIDTMQQQDKSYAVVRQRIADTKAGNVFTDLSKPTPASSTPPASSSQPAPAPAPPATPPAH
jgi:tetratricopeptide (TPR) repeat protein